MPNKAPSSKAPNPDPPTKPPNPGQGNPGQGTSPGKPVKGKRLFDDDVTDSNTGTSTISHSFEQGSASTSESGGGGTC